MAKHVNLPRLIRSAKTRHDKAVRLSKMGWTCQLAPFVGRLTGWPLKKIKNKKAYFNIFNKLNNLKRF